MTRTTQQYLDLITPFHATRARFVATVQISVDPLARGQAALLHLPTDYDLDAAVGPQLDAIGVRVGRARQLHSPVQDDWFSWDTDGKGWDEGYWLGPYDLGTVVTNLDDDTYRRLLRAKVFINEWDGTVAGQQAALDAYFTDPTLSVVAVDASRSILPTVSFSWDRDGLGWEEGSWYDGTSAVAANLCLEIIVSGKLPSTIDLEVLAQELVITHPAGVAVDVAVTTVNHAPVFGFDMDTAAIGGWDTGAWANSPQYIVDNALN